MKTINTQARPFYAAIILSLWAALLLQKLFSGKR